MENNKKRQKHFDRITLDAKTLQVIDSWIAQVKTYKSGVDLSRKDLLNWLVQNLPTRLSGSQEQQLAEAHYSELRFLHYAARKIKEAKAKGETLTLKDIEGSTSAPKVLNVRRKRKTKDTAVTNNDLDQPIDLLSLTNETLKSTS